VVFGDGNEDNSTAYTSRITAEKIGRQSRLHNLYIGMVAFGVGEAPDKAILCELANAINGNLYEQVKIGESVIESFHFGNPKSTDYQEILKLITTKPPSAENSLRNKIAYLDEQIEALKKERLEISGMQAKISAHDVE
jgi:hypothetical protein